jgi:hypothetical protein
MTSTAQKFNTYPPYALPIAQWWLVAGTPENWEVALNNGNIWRLRETEASTKKWNKLAAGDRLLLYSKKPAGGVIGHVTVVTKSRQDKPLWPEEIASNAVIWPLRFEFDIDYILPSNR